MANPKRLDAIKMLSPLKEVRYDTGNYLLVIKDALGVEHYFDYDGKYDGWGTDCDDNGNCLLPIDTPEN